MNISTYNRLFCLAFCILICLHPIRLSAQSATDQSIVERFSAYTKLMSPEKLYLHTDREVYCVGDTVWFKGYLKNSSYLSEFPESNYIYVELISSMVKKNVNTGNYQDKESVMERVKIKRIGNIFTGYLHIPENLNTGISIIRGYTYWMMNKEPEYMFSKNIEIRNPMKDDYVKSLAENEVLENKKYAEIGVANPLKKDESLNYDIDVQFMPESGRYVTERNSVMAFKAIDNKGMGTKIKGSLFLNNGDSVSFESNSLGMGKFVINLLETDKELKVKIENSDGWVKYTNFPMPEESAVVINCIPDTNAIWMEVYSKNIDAGAEAYIVVYDASEIYFKVPYDLSEKKVKLEYRHLTPGINNAAVVDADGNIYANRTFFVYPASKNKLVSTDKLEYSAKERVRCLINVEDLNGNPVSGNFSLSVSDDIYAPYGNNGHNIVTYMLLGSELSGFVERPQEYFSDDIPFEERVKNVDILMLAQGWKYYNLSDILKCKSEMPVMGREYTQSISGRVYGLFGTAKRSIISFLAPSINYTAAGQLDTSGWFALNGLDFPDSTQFIVAATGINGSKRRFTPILDRDIFAVMHSYPKYLIGKSYTNTYKQAALSEYYNSGGELVYSINPVYITGLGSKRVDNISPMPSYTFKEGQYRDEKELEPYKSYDLLTYIVTTCPPLRFGDSTIGGYPYIVCRTQKVASRMGISSGWGEILVFMNGIQVRCSDIAGMTVDDITGFAYIKGADAARFDNSGSLSPRSVVMIKSKLYERNAANIASSTPLGWQKPVKRYFPKYETLESKRYKEPMRSVLYWNPDVNIENGKAEIDFYTSSHHSNYTLILEGLTNNREPLFIQKKIIREK